MKWLFNIRHEPFNKGDGMLCPEEMMTNLKHPRKDKEIHGECMQKK